MRNSLNVLLIASLLALAACRSDNQAKEGELTGTITISGAWALYPMAIKWAEEFQKIHPYVRIDVAAGGAGKGMADALAGVADIGSVSREIYPEEIEQGAWWVSVTKDAVVPTVNVDNPFLAVLLTQGVTREQFTAIWMLGTTDRWEDIMQTSDEDLIHIYTRSDACGAAQTWAQYLGGAQEDLLGVGVYGDPGLAEAVKRDALGIGYNNINYAYDTQTRLQVEGIRILPIDLDGDSHIDSTEDFYETRDEIVLAIASGVYPSPPARDLHFVCQGRPEKEVVHEFIRWVLTDGQQYVSEAGYISLPPDMLQRQLANLGE